MCCTTKKNIHDIDYAKTIIYTKDEMLEMAEEGENEALFYEYESIAFCILFDKGCFKSIGLSSMGFYAMSRGTEAYTDTGYQSNFAYAGKDSDEKDIEEYFKNRLLEFGIDLDNPKPQFLSQVNEVVHTEQLSLF